MTTRRDFITKAGLLTGTALLLKSELLSAKAASKPGIQLYTLRNELPKDVKGAIANVGKAGYGFVETFGYDRNKGYWGLPAKDFSKLLKDNGLTSHSGHYGLDSYFATGDTADLNMYFEVAHALGQEYILVPSLPHDLIKTTEDCKKIAEKLDKMAGLCKTAGLKTGYHNHNFEWRPVEGTTFYDILLKYTDPAQVHMEMDLFWVVRAGQDPAKILKDHPGRFMFAHVKDRDKTQTNLNTEVGKGSIDYKAIIPAAKAAGIKYFVMEQENFINIDPYTSITESANYMKSVLHV